MSNFTNTHLLHAMIVGYKYTEDVSVLLFPSIKNNYFEGRPFVLIASVPEHGLL